MMAHRAATDFIAILCDRSSSRATACSAISGRDSCATHELASFDVASQTRFNTLARC
jgi:hypothetical protein